MSLLPILNVRSATEASAVLLAGFLVARQIPHRVAAFVSAACFEIALVCGLFALWQVANRITRGHTTGGLERGRWVWHAERVMHFPSEVSVQRLILGHPDVVRVVNYYYDTAHLSFMVIFLIWLWLRHRDRYPYWRNTVAFFTLMSLLIQMVAVAPPRLIGNTGLVDTAALYGQSVYAVVGDIADQYAAMPSIHVGWAVLISIAVVTSSTSQWRWLFALHGPLTIFVVVATANHYWLDAVVALVLLAIAMVMSRGVEQVKARYSPSEEALPAQIQQSAFS
ncbi:MAG TPA: phosphatase PAP2 family protein [Mycobacteriales bacterium]|nr:phosphatase PAP2 family protein [Mycobacteriales bacterium]